MARRDELAGRMAEAVVKRLVTRKLVEVRDETRALEVTRRILSENFLAEEKIEADARALLMDHAKEIRDSASDYKRVFALADRIVADLSATEAVTGRGLADDKVRGQLRTEVFRVLEDETKLDESIDEEVRRTLSSYSRPAPEGSAEWEVLYKKTRDEVYRRRFRL